LRSITTQLTGAERSWPHRRRLRGAGENRTFLEKGGEQENYGSRAMGLLAPKSPRPRPANRCSTSGCAEVDPALAKRIGAELIFLDGTLFTDDETGQGFTKPRSAWVTFQYRVRCDYARLNH
jgi:hypothetical protein